MISLFVTKIKNDNRINFLPITYINNKFPNINDDDHEMIIKKYVLSSLHELKLLWMSFPRMSFPRMSFPADEFSVDPFMILGRFR